MPIRIGAGGGRPSPTHLDAPRGLQATNAANAPSGPGPNVTAPPTASGGPSGATGATSTAWRRFLDPANRPEAHIASFRTADQRGPGHVDFEWEGPGDAIRFEMAVEVTRGSPDDVVAQVWTNADRNDDPGQFRAVPMERVSFDGRTAVFRLDLPVHKVGNYRAVGRVSVDGGERFDWMGQRGIPDVKFRPRDERHEALSLMEISVGNVNHDDASGRPGTFADLMEPGSPDTNGKLTLEHLKAQGKNAIWLIPPFDVYAWPDRPPEDTAGSPYAVKDLFSIRTELARSARGLTGKEAEEAALAEFKTFLAKARELGIKVILDVPLNHVGHDFRFKDLFITTGPDGTERREVREGDYSQVATTANQLEEAKRRIDSPHVPDSMDYVAPWMFGSRHGNAWGADSFFDRALGGWFEWFDTAQLNHGRRRVTYDHWEEHAKNEQQMAVIHWLSRVLRFWAVDVGVDGFRLDHLAGLPQEILELALNHAQADVDRHRPGESLFVLGEDFHNRTETLSWVDAGQAGWFHDFLAAKAPADIERIATSPYFGDVLALSNHDEQRALAALGGDTEAFRQLTQLLFLLGGSVSEVAGDHFGATDRLPFKQYRSVAALRSIDAEDRKLADALGRVGRLRLETPALLDDNRGFLRPVSGAPDPRLLAMSRLPDDESHATVITLANLDSKETRENAFHLDDALRRRIDPSRRYQVRDLVGNDPSAPLWSPPLTGQELLDRGLFARVGPRGVQVLQLEPVP